MISECQNTNSGSNPVRLEPGDALSYSAGSTQTGPLGFRKLRRPCEPNRGGILTAALGRWPEISEILDEEQSDVLFINAYPAAIGAVGSVITVDTYLSPRVLSRALQLGRLGGHPTILAGQPLFLADALLRHVEAGRPLPAKLLVGVGGYAMTRSLEKTLESLLAPRVEHLLFVQYFGAADRLHPDVEEELESWSEADWRRRTGYLRREGGKIWIQLREGEAPREETELDFYDFARCFGFSWLDKPYWR